MTAKSASSMPSWTASRSRLSAPVWRMQVCSSTASTVPTHGPTRSVIAAAEACDE